MPAHSLILTRIGRYVHVRAAKPNIGAIRGMNVFANYTFLSIHVVGYHFLDCQRAIPMYLPDDPTAPRLMSVIVLLRLIVGVVARL